MRWTEDQLADHLERRGVAAPTPPADVSNPPFKPPGNEAGAFAHGRLPAQDMNKLEQAYAAHLDWRKLAGEILWWRFEAIKVRLADGAWYTGDFFLLTNDLMLEVHETKGFWREAARVRIKVAASIYPFRFIAVKKTKTGWDTEAFG